MPEQRRKSCSKRLWAVLLFVAGGLCGPAAAKDDELARAEAATAQPANTVGIVQEYGDLKIRWQPYVETESGYDSNPDNQFVEDGSAFVKAEAGLRTTLERANQYYALTVRGRYIDYTDLVEHNRSDLKVALDSKHTISDTETITTYSYFLRDLISLARADIYQSASEYAKKTDTYKFKLSSTTHVEHNFDNDVQGADTFDDFSVSRARAFDYIRSDGQASLLTFRQAQFQPFVIVDVADINYYNQTPGVSVDRDAQEVFAIAGIRYQPNESFRIDLGYRFNDREFDDKTVRHKNTDFIDVNMFWQPVDAFKVTAVVERYFDEQTSSFGVVDDVQSYGMTVDWTLAPKWRLAGTAFYDRERALGDDVLYRKITTTLALTYDVNANLEVFTSGLAKWVEEDFSGDNYERYKLGLGARIKF